jgi:hypothetical protein
MEPPEYIDDGWSERHFSDGNGRQQRYSLIEQSPTKCAEKQPFLKDFLLNPNVREKFDEGRPYAVIQFGSMATPYLGRLSPHPLRYNNASAERKIRTEKFL